MVSMSSNTMGLPGPGDEAQLELINNISKLFQSLESKHSETRNLLDLLAGFILRKFENELDFPLLQEISKILRLSCETCHENFTSSQDLRNHSTMTHCWIPLQRIDASENFGTPQTEIGAGPISNDFNFSNLIIGKIEIPQDDDEPRPSGAEIEEQFLIPISNSPPPPPEELDLGQGPQICLPSSKQDQSLEETEPKKIGKPTRKRARRVPKCPCPVENCNKLSVGPAHLNIHIRSHTGEKPYPCSWPNCTWKFANAGGLARHLRAHAGDRPYRCELCFKGFNGTDEVLRHINKAHNNKGSSGANQTGLGLPNPAMTSRIEVPAAEESIASPKSAEADPKHPPERGTLPNINPQTQISALAPESKINRKTPENDRKHKYIYKFPCPYENCDRILGSITHLNVHIRRRHTGAKPFICSWPNCPWKFSSREELTRHSRTHTGDKPYQCDVCLKWFSQNYDLLKHRKNVHNKGPLTTTNQTEIPNDGDENSSNPIISQIEVPRNSDFPEPTVKATITSTNDKEYKEFETPGSDSQSQICSATSKENQILQRKPKSGRRRRRRQVRIPKFLCPYENCNKLFVGRCHLNIHIRTHTGEKPYVCSWPHCTWKFKTTVALDRHIRSHTGDKPYQCGVCLKWFGRSDYLSRHTIRLHKKGSTMANQTPAAAAEGPVAEFEEELLGPNSYSNAPESVEEEKLDGVPGYSSSPKADTQTQIPTLAPRSLSNPNPNAPNSKVRTRGKSKRERDPLLQ